MKDYEKKYKEALERAKKYRLKEDLIITQDIFPELKESEDERIRKEIISAIKEDWPGHTDWIAWLEKQGEPVEINPTGFDTRLQVLIGNFDSLPKEELIGSLSFWMNVVQNDGTYKSDEKQGKQKDWTEEDKKMLKWVTGYLENKMLNAPIGEERTACKNAIAWFEKLKDEQKSVDKAEPKKLKKTKFKAGDRIIGIVSGMQYYITEVCDDYYNTESGCIIMFCAQDNFELYKQKSTWSEEDEQVFNTITNSLDRRRVERVWHTTIEEVVNWLKSLKDRVQPQPKQEWKQENTSDLTDFENAMMHIGGSFFGENAGLDPNDTFVVKEQAKILLEMAPKQEWSEEDERHLNSIIKRTVAYGDSSVHGLIKDDIDWLKDLIERVHPQNLTVTDEELSQAKKDAYNDALDKIEYHSGEPTFDDGWSAAIGYIKKKSLRPQSQWKPSDEQMKGIECAIKTLQHQLNVGDKRLNSLYDALKKLKG